MDKLERIEKIVNWIVFAYLLGIIILTWMGKLTYGHGLGDLIFFFMSMAFAIIHLLILVIFIHARREPLETGYGLIIGIVILLIAVAFTYKFTIGRGSENRWKGKVFESVNEIKINIQALTPHPASTGHASPQALPI